jgi:hypothetical protein
MILDLTEFLKRAYAVGIKPIVSGTTFFLSRNGTTVRVKLDEEKGPHYAVSHLSKGNDITYQSCTVDAASRALKLPRR